ncbi:glycosyltransferase family 4 protein [Leeuwenhoekiella sp. MAR_2009_132]|uniref:glycosyltransferase family 4 protein n=1 Tax=Leeuwenhoekiella sp. MAR_2009_132 TaxID=1392489 RepID=UPI00048B38D6|nr:glycosyltransferase family 4 protein [Leeuwenhoekiella sp. MAR_2009_132]
MKRKILYIGNKLATKAATPTGIDTLGPNLVKEGYLVRYAGTKASKLFRFFEMLYAIVKNKSWVDYVLIDTYSTQNFWFAYYSGILCSLLSIPYIPILHGGNLPGRLKSNPESCKRLFNKSFLNVSPSLYLKEAFEKEGYTVQHIPNAIAIERYTFKMREHIRPKLLWVRSFASIYNPLLAVKLVEEFQAEFPNVELCMVGPEKDGSLRICKDYAEKNNLPVRFTGKLSKSSWIELSQGYDIFINTTHFDNFPVSILEAMALGLPVISTAVGGIPYLITDRITGLLVEENTVTKFSEQIKDLIFKDLLAQDISANARLMVENCDWKNVKNLWHKILF